MVPVAPMGCPSEIPTVHIHPGIRFFFVPDSRKPGIGNGLYGESFLNFYEIDLVNGDSGFLKGLIPMRAPPSMSDLLRQRHRIENRPGA